MYNTCVRTHMYTVLQQLQMLGKRDLSYMYMYVYMYMYMYLS